MNFFKRKMMRQIFKAFDMMNRCYNDDGDGSQGGADEGHEPDNDSGDFLDENLDDGSGDDDGGGGEPSEPYYGNTDMNPEGRPLKRDLDIEGYSKEDVDGLLGEMGEAAFMSDEDIKAFNDENPDNKIVLGEDGEGGDSGKDENDDDDPEKKEGDDPDKEESEEITDKEMEGFYADQGITEDVFGEYSEKVKKTLLSSFFGVEQAENSSKLDAVTTEHAALKLDYETVINDPVVAARIEEINSNKKFVANDLVGVTDKQVSEIDAAFDEDGGNTKVKELVNKIIKENAKAAVGIERQVSDDARQVKTDNKDIMSTLKKIGEMDPKKFGKIKENNFVKFIGNAGHAEKAAYDSGVGEVMTFLQKRKFTPDQVREMGPKGIYNMYAHEKGWDTEKIKRIQNSKVDKLLAKMKKPATARLLKSGNNQSQPGGRGKTAIGTDMKALKKDMLLGKTQEHSRLLRNALESDNSKVSDRLIALGEEVDFELQGN